MLGKRRATSPDAGRLVVVRDFDLVGIATLPSEADAVLIVDADAVLPAAVATQALQAVPGRDRQIADTLHTVELVELALGDSPELLRAGPTGRA